MDSMILLGGLIAAILGAVIGQLKFRNALAGALAGAALGVGIAWFVFREPATVLAVETPDGFESKVLQHDQPVVVDFYADWCPPCRRLAPTIEKLGEHYQGKIRFVKVDVDKGRAVSRQYRVRAIPTVILFVNGEPAYRWVGPRPASEYKSVLNRLAKAD